MEQVQELETSGWIIRVGDVFSNGYEEHHLKVTKIELENDDNGEFSEVDDAKVHCVMVDPRDHSKIVSEEQWHRAWYINECWYK